MHRASSIAALGLACLLALGTARAAHAVDEPIPGDSHVVISGTLVKMAAKDGPFDLPAGDPTVEGGQLQIVDTGGGSSMLVDLPADGWKRFGNKHRAAQYKYQGAGTPDDPCVNVTVTAKSIAFVCIGAGVTLDTPFAGDSAITLTVDGTRYCAQFGGRTQRNNEKQLRRRNAPAPAACVDGGGTSTSTSSTSSTSVEETTTTSTSSTSSTSVEETTTTSVSSTSSTTGPEPTTSTSSTSSTSAPTPTTSSTTTPEPTTSSTSTSSTTSSTAPTPTTSSTTTPEPTTSSTSTSSTTSSTAPTPTTSTSSTTSTTIAACCNGAAAVEFATIDAPGDCGDLLNNTGALVTNLECSGLYTGGGGNSVPLPFAVPDQGLAVTAITTCAGQTATLGGTTSAQTGSNRTCTTAGCLFGAPLAVPNPGSTPTSVCVLNAVDSDPMGSLACDTGATSLSLPLRSVLFLTGDTATDPSDTIAGIQPCPICRDPGSGFVCTGGTNNGMACVPGTTDLSGNAAYPTSHDCPPDPMFNIGTLPINFSLSSGTVTWSGTIATNDTGNTASVQNRVFSGFCRDADGTGAFAGTSPATAEQCWENGVAVGPACSGTFESCEQRNNGAFGPSGGANRTIIAIGNAMSILGGSGGATLVSVFSIPPTFDPTVDAAGDLPGPGAVSLPGTATLCPTAGTCP